MAAKKTITPAKDATIKRESTITATRTDDDPTHKGDPPAGTDDGVDSLLAGVSTGRSAAVDRASRGQSAPEDDPAEGRTKGGKSSVEQSSGGSSDPPPISGNLPVGFDESEGVRAGKGAKALAEDFKDSTLGEIGTTIGSGGPKGPTRDGIRQAIAEQDAISSTTTTNATGGSKTTNPASGIKVVEGSGIRSETNLITGAVTVVDSHNRTETTVRADGSTITRDADDTTKVLDETPKLIDPSPRQGPTGSSEPESPVDDADQGEPDDSGDDDLDPNGQSVEPDDDPEGQSVDPELDPNGQSVEPDDVVTGASDDPELDPEGQSLDPELDPEGQSVEPEDDPNGQSVEPEPEPEDDPDGQSVEPEPAPEDDPNGQSVEPDDSSDDDSSDDDENGQSTEPEDGQSTDGETSAEQSGDPGGGDPGDPDGGVTLPPEISAAIQADIAKLRGARPQTGDGATDPGPDDTGDEVDRSVAVVPDKFNQLLGGDNFGPDRDDNVHTGNVDVPTGPQSDGGFTDPGPDDDTRVQTSGPEQDPFDRGPALKPIESRTTASDDGDDEDDDGATIGSPLIATSVVRQFQFDRVPSIADDDDDPDDD